MAPIRIAMIGLSASAKTSWAEEGHLPYLDSPRGRSKYEIVALLNSSVGAAEKARQHFGLPSTVKTYGDPEAVAADPEVDLVVCNTRVDTHLQTVEPSIKAGKAVFVEWPLAENLERARALTDQLKHDRNIIGLQGRFSPIAHKVRELLAAGKIGKVLSSEVRGFGLLLPRADVPEGLEYFGKRSVGGNQITIGFVHMTDTIYEALGEFKFFQSQMYIHRPELGILDEKGSRAKTLVSDVPDFLSMHGFLAQGKAPIANNAGLSIVYRSGPPFKGKPGFTWTINGEKGELYITSPAGPYLQADSYDEPITIELHDHATDEITSIAWDWMEWQKELPVRSRLTAEVYERYAENVDNSVVPESRRWPGLKEALARMEELEVLWGQYDCQMQKTAAL